MTHPLLAQPFPAFCLPNHQGQSVTQADLIGHWSVIYCYPKAATPGCTTQACGLRDTLAALTGLNACVYGLSPDPIAKLLRFHQAQQLNFPLLSDEHLVLLQALGVWQNKQFMGRQFMGVVRTTFIVAPNGAISQVLEGFKTASHHALVVEELARLQASNAYL